METTSTSATLEDLWEISRLMAAFPGYWWIAGGWAVDLWIGGPTREHEDVEVSVLRHDQMALRQRFATWRWSKVDSRPEGNQWVPLAIDEYVSLPAFQLRAERAAAEHAPPGSAFEVFLNDVIDGLWVSRRHATVRLSLDRVVCRSPTGIPVLAPEIQLLYKARLHRPKDEHDFQMALPRLDARRRAWLSAALTEYHPGDPWLAAL